LGRQYPGGAADILNAQNVARDAAIPRSSVDRHFSVSTDTLLADFLPSYRFDGLNGCNA
jgi:hypothetical protein